MHNLDWDNVRYFLEVVRYGSLTQAAQNLGVNQTTVSRRVTALEEHLDKKLFERSGHSWMITPVGERLIDAARHMADEANSIERYVLADCLELSGLLRVTLADVCTQRLAMPAIQAFAQQYPDVDLEIIATHGELDLAAREADIALRATDEPPPNLVGRRIAQIAYAVYGSQDTLARVQAGGDNGACITWLGDGHARPPWIEKNFPRTRRVYRTSELGVMLEMTKCGVGMAQMPCAAADPEPLLHRIPVRYTEPGWGLWVLSHIDLRTTARVRVFKNMLVEVLEKQRDRIEGRPTGDDAR